MADTNLRLDDAFPEITTQEIMTILRDIANGESGGKFVCRPEDTYSNGALKHTYYNQTICNGLKPDDICSAFMGSGSNGSYEYWRRNTLVSAALDAVVEQCELSVEGEGEGNDVICFFSYTNFPAGRDCSEQIKTQAASLLTAIERGSTETVEAFLHTVIDKFQASRSRLLYLPTKEWATATLPPATTCANVGAHERMLDIPAATGHAP